MTSSMTTLYDKLLQAHFSAELRLCLRKRISVSEKGSEYVMELQPQMECCAFLIDGYLVTDKTSDKCDYVVLAKTDAGEWAEVFVELKGSDVNHAIKQLRSTINNPLFTKTARQVRKARIVMANRIPSNTGNSVIERAKIDFKKMGCDFRPIKSRQPDILKF